VTEKRIYPEQLMLPICTGKIEVLNLNLKTFLETLNPKHTHPPPPPLKMKRSEIRALGRAIAQC
jgi:hypothetical protein